MPTGETDPQQVLPGARTIVTLAVSYAGPPFVEPDVPAGPRARPPRAGEVARYARCADYHKILRAALEGVTRFINHLGGAGARSLWYVDTGPLLERDLAQRAGLGFIGKHTNLISRKLGNWIFLAEIITTLELEPRRAGKKPLRLLLPLPDGLPDRRHHRPLSIGRPPLHLLFDH